ncbi:Flagellar motor switch protein FliG [compost metagenome]
MAANAQLTPPDVPRTEGDLGVLSYERYLEESLDRGLSAYLGADRFIVQVKAILKETEARASQPAFMPQSLPMSQGLPQLPSSRLSPWETDGPPILPGLHFGGEESQQLAPMAPAAMPMLPNPAPVVQAPAASRPEREIDRLKVSVVLPTSVTIQDEDFIRNMVTQKVDHAYARDLIVEINRREFPSVPSGPVDTSPLPTWAWAALAAGAGLGLGWLLTRGRRRSETTSIAPQVQAAPAMWSVPAEPQGPNLEKLRHELTMLILSEPELAERYIGQLLAQELGMERASLLTRALGAGVSRRLFAGVSEETWRALELKQFERSDVPAEETQQALSEAIRAIVRERHTAGPRSGARRNEPFAFLQTLDDSQILYILQYESPRVQALAFSQLPPQRAIGLMQLLNPGELGAVTAAMGALSEIPLETFSDIALHLAAKATEAPRFSTGVTNGIGVLVGLLDHSDREMERRIMQELSTQNPQVLKQVKQSYVAFDDLPKLSKDVLRDAVRDFPKEQLTEILRDAPADVVAALVGALNERGRMVVEEALKGPSLLDAKPEAREAMRRDLLNRIRQTSRVLVIPQAGGN